MNNLFTFHNRSITPGIDVTKKDGQFAVIIGFRGHGSQQRIIKMHKKYPPDIVDGKILLAHASRSYKAKGGNYVASTFVKSFPSRNGEKGTLRALTSESDPLCGRTDGGFKILAGDPKVIHKVSVTSDGGEGSRSQDMIILMISGDVIAFLPEGDDGVANTQVVTFLKGKMMCLPLDEWIAAEEDRLKAEKEAAKKKKIKESEAAERKRIRDSKIEKLRSKLEGRVPTILDEEGEESDMDQEEWEKEGFDNLSEVEEHVSESPTIKDVIEHIDPETSKEVPVEIDEAEATDEIPVETEVQASEESVPA